MFPRLITMQGNPDLDPTKMSDFEAGLHFMAVAAREIPGITMGQLFAMGSGRMAGWLTDLKHAAGTVTDGIGSVMSSVVNMVGNKAGDTVRLAADQKVQGAIVSGVGAYATGGASLAAQSIFGSGSASGGTDIISAMGQYWKQLTGGGGSSSATGNTAMAGFSWPMVAILGSVVIGGVFLTRSPSRR